MTNQEYRLKLACYMTAMHQAKLMLYQNIICEEDYEKISLALGEKYGIQTGQIFAKSDLIIPKYNGNMSHNQEVSYADTNPEN